ncbi:MAG: hypothetical protein WAK23_09320, partial [Terriglobales bacterium]
HLNFPAVSHASQLRPDIFPAQVSICITIYVVIVLESNWHKMMMNRGEKDLDEILGCNCSGVRKVKAGSCQVVDQGILNRDAGYDMPPGKYTVMGRLRAADNSKSQPTGQTKREGLTIVIEQQ